MLVWVGLVLSLVSAVAISWAYTREHEAATRLPLLSVKTPLASARALARSRGWLVGFAFESGGWIVYLVALRLAPLALVQTVGAAGIAVLALVQSGGHLGRLSRRERVATAVIVVGLVLLGLSLVGTHQVGRQPGAGAAIVWLGSCVGAAARSDAGADPADPRGRARVGGRAFSSQQATSRPSSLSPAAAG